jgi:hypothetical protein
LPKTPFFGSYHSRLSGKPAIRKGEIEPPEKAALGKIPISGKIHLDVGTLLVHSAHSI